MTARPYVLMFISLIAISALLPACMAETAPPGAIQVAVGSDYVDLWWQPSEGATNYLVYRGSGADDMVQVANVSAPVTAYHDGGLEDGSSYIYYVTALGEEGESAPGPSVSATVPSKQSDPIILPVLAIVLSAIAVQICIVMLLYMFKTKMKL